MVQKYYCSYFLYAEMANHEKLLIQVFVDKFEITVFGLTVIIIASNRINSK